MTANVAWPSVFDDPPPADLVTLRKLVKRPPDDV